MLGDLRRRLTSGYDRVSSEDEDVYVPLNISAACSLPSFQDEDHRVFERGAYGNNSHNTCTKICFFFSLSGVIFLSTIAVYLQSESPNLKVSLKYSNKKSELLQGVGGAIALYVACMMIAGYAWYRHLSLRRLFMNSARIN